MANFTAADVKRLREQTGAGMMDCKNALEEASGDLEAAEPTTEAAEPTAEAAKPGETSVE